MPEINSTSDALRTLYRQFDVFDGARQGVESASIFPERDVRDLAADRADGRISSEDLQAVAGNEDFTEAEQEAAEYLLDNPELLDGLDGVDDDGNLDDRISLGDVTHFIDAHRNELPDDVVVLADARIILEVGKRDGNLLGGNSDDLDSRLVFFAEYAARRAVQNPEYPAVLIEEIVRQDQWAPDTWITRGRLDALEAEGRITPEQAQAVEDLLPTPTSELPAPAEDELRVLNLNAGMGAANGFSDPLGTDADDIPALARLIADSDADIVTLQELFDDVIAGPDNVRELERALEALTGDTWNLHFDPARRNAQGGSGNLDSAVGVPYGNAILVREGGNIASSASMDGGAVSLPGDGIEARIVQGVTVTLADGSAIDVFNTHTADVERSTPEQRAAQYERIDELVRASDNPVILAGDFNRDYSDTSEAVDRVALRALTEGENGVRDTGAAADLPTSNHGFGNRIDYVFERGLEQSGSTHVVDGGTSDHAGIVVDVRMPAN